MKVNKPISTAILGNGRVIVTEFGNHRVQVFEWMCNDKIRRSSPSMVYLVRFISQFVVVTLSISRSEISRSPRYLITAIG